MVSMIYRSNYFYLLRKPIIFYEKRHQENKLFLAANYLS